ncbi:transcriptional regulator [Ammoniphilus sp. CFH 90114]|uniref:transcriptional regulator n=1 Tax=Ammoniphilus sp. CFH 90114 TaxID=2493665 RepID=UPI00100DE06A|nr:transcriptional regulator [Ammoniphilus sp. CFH 90114]RXT02778.1 transcriptional regulator [Ammoniphilus sp. CFH 90114]
MEIKVAIIAPDDFMIEIINVSKAYPSLKLLSFGYKEVGETSDLVEQCINQVDVLLFAGPIPYQIACEKVKTQKPMIYLPHTGASLYRVFFQLLRQHFNRYQGDRLKFSIDILTKEEVEERLEELDIIVDQMYVKEYNIGLETDEIMQFHYDLWMDQKVDAVLTSVASVYKNLVELGVPCYRIFPTKSMIHDGLQRAQLEGENVHLSDTQLAIGIINVDNFSKKRSSSEYEIQRKKLELEQILLDYKEETQALMNWSDRDEITFVTTRGVMERTTNHFSCSPLLDQIISQLNLTVSIGIGLGRTANEAESKAREALAKAKSSGGGNCYIVMQDGYVDGPVGEEYRLVYSVRTDDPERIKIARQAGLSVATINKMISYCENHGSSKVTAVELANGFQITIRSARRILSKLEQSDLAVVVGEEQPVSKGRPRQLYDLKLPM